MTRESSDTMNSPYRNVEWIKSSRSGSTNNCVEIAVLAPETRGVRDSKKIGGPVLTFSPAAWSMFLDSAVTGRLGS
ncbi:DUF397 domain-containing protein [Streptomyces sp. ACA25]|uniref:DUF397 domain-containing protein n=1 Tax=Streptomyces sp. ACA25 TaxID=3022596 RepID=UPI0023074AAD|nr:DUF397 domain-containing protein [Streptomyces sp. ACA25]MDB1088073.1 DUF397 domain-containing protein [Streptomyces sp. ACA25]